MEIDQSRVDSQPVDGYLSGIRVLETTENFELEQNSNNKEILIAPKTTFTILTETLPLIPASYYLRMADKPTKTTLYHKS